MSQSIEKAIQAKFKKHRLVFWYDVQDELSEVFDSLALPAIEKIQIEGNEFQIKYRVVQQHPDQKFLIYSSQERKTPATNWLLDLELAHTLFHTDKAATVLQEMGLDYGFNDLVKEHIAFFEAKERKLKLREILGKGDSHAVVRRKMVAVTCRTDHLATHAFIQALAAVEIEGEKNRIEHDIDRFGLSGFFWQLLQNHYGYAAATPSTYDFLLFCFESVFDKKAGSREIGLLLSLWQDSSLHKANFEKIARRTSNDLGIEQRVAEKQLEALLGTNLFKISENKIVHELVQRIQQKEIAVAKLQEHIKTRENKFWYPDFAAFYEALKYAGLLIHAIEEATPSFQNFDDVTLGYKKTFYKIDTYYRKFIYQYRATNQNSILSDLARFIERKYVNDWLLPYNDQWQKIVDTTQEWPVKQANSQRSFFKNYVQPYLDKQKRVFVIVSDALRYEIGVELTQKLKKENRYDASIEGVISSVPSYTQLGMASLLPLSLIEIEKAKDTVLVDGASSSGVAARAVILDKATSGKATAIQAADFMAMDTRTQGRAFIKPYDAIYIYNNRIDKTGDEKMTEERLVNAVEEELAFLTELLKKIANVNGTNIVITADHGFLYQYEPIDQSDFTEAEIKGDSIKKNRRFVLGENISASEGLTSFDYSVLGLEGNGKVLFPRSINRLRVKGAGSRFVHGGTSVQEIMVPVILVNKKRKDTTSKTDVDIILNTDKITTNILTVSFLQKQPVTDTLLPRELRMSIQAKDGAVLSDVFKYNFDLKEENPRQREVKHRFTLLGIATGKYKNQTVHLMLEEPVANSNQLRKYKAYAYTLNISFTNDFDF